MKGIILLILTVIFWGTTPILEKIGLAKASPLLGVAIRSIAVAIFMLGYLSVSSNVKSLALVNLKTIIIFTISGILAGGLGMLTYFGALKVGVASRVVPLVATYPLITALLSVVILGENVTLPRFIGTVLIVAGVWLVK